MWFDLSSLFDFEEVGSLGVLSRALKRSPSADFVWLDRVYWVYEQEGYP